MNLHDISPDLMISLAALAVSGLAAVVGMWVERDHDRPTRMFAALAVLCLLTTAVSMWQAIGQAKDAAAAEETMANVLAKLDTIMQKSGVEVPAINDLVKSELTVASRSNPDIVKKMAQRVADSGGNPASVLGAYLPADEVKRMQRGGDLKVERPSGDRQRGAPVAQAEPRRVMQFGGGPAQIRPAAPVQAAPAAVAAAAAPAVAAAPVAVAATEPPPAVVAPPPVAPPPVQPAAAAPVAQVAAAPAKPSPPKHKAAAPARARPAADDSVDIYEEAEKDLRRKH